MLVEKIWVYVYLWDTLTPLFSGEFSLVPERAGLFASEGSVLSNSFLVLNLQTLFTDLFCICFSWFNRSGITSGIQGLQEEQEDVWSRGVSAETSETGRDSNHNLISDAMII